MGIKNIVSRGYCCDSDEYNKMCGAGESHLHIEEIEFVDDDGPTFEEEDETFQSETSEMFQEGREVKEGRIW